jgi:RNA-directed DNA polymerase
MQEGGNAMTKRRKDKPAVVPFRAKQVGEPRPRWWWVEPSVWTERMLTALEHGVKGGVWFSLIDKVYSEGNLQAAFAAVAANHGAAGVDHVTIAQFAARLPENLEHLHASLQAGTYVPQAVRRVWIPKPGTNQQRPLGIPTVRDRVAQAALRSVLEPIFERDFAEQSYGFRPGRGCQDALARVEELLKAGYTYVVDADLKSYFDTIPHDKLMDRLRQKVADGRVLALIEAFLKAGIMDGLEEWAPEEGSPQGSVISPLLSNIYLDPLDHRMAAAGFQMVRYADDFVVLCRSRQEAEAALEVVRQWVAEAGLTLHPEKTRIADANREGEGFDFLGYHFERGYRWPRPKSIQKLKTALRPKTRRTSGRSKQAIIADINRTLQGWFGYFRHSHYTTFEPLDGWVRMRLRSILRKRQKKRGRGRGSDHQRWPNAYFAKLGLYTLNAAHALASQSSTR